MEINIGILASRSRRVTRTTEVVTVGVTRTQSYSRMMRLSSQSFHPALPIHTIVRGHFVMKNRVLNEQARGTGRSVHAIQRMPTPSPKNTDQTMAAVTGGRKG